MPRFSVVVPAYNAQGTLPETLDGMLSQQFDDWECVVVDDGSTDKTPSIVQGYVDRDRRFKLVSQRNTGTAGAYQAGVNAASSELLVICSADDLLLPEHLQAMDEFVRTRPDYEIYSCNGEYLYQESGARRPVYWQREWLRERSLSFAQLAGDCFYSVGALFRRRVYEDTGGHRLGALAEDYDLWLRAMAKGARHRYTPRILSVHRVSDFQQSANLERSLEARIEVYQHLLSSESLDEDRRAVVQEGIVRDRGLIQDWPVVAGLEKQSRQLRSLVERTVGTHRTETMMRMIHKVSRVTRPARRMLIRRRKG